MSEMRYIAASDIAHIIRITADVDFWARYDGYIVEKDMERLMPVELLIGYTTNLLWYWKEPYMHRNSTKILAKVEIALKQISRIVFRADFPDMECRMYIMRLMHDAGYGVQYSAEYRL